MNDQQNDIREGKFFAVISYISFLCIVSLLLKQNNKFAVYHAKQGLVLFVFEVGAFLLSVIPFLGWFIKVFGFALFVLLSLWGILQALTGSCGRIRLISDIADKVIL